MHLRDRNGKVIGRIMESNDGILRLYNSIGAYCGKYDSRDNKTYDSYGAYYGDGNLLTMLLN